MKRIISLALALTLLLSFISPNKSLANTNVKLNSVVEKTHKLLELSSDFKFSDYSIYKEEGITIYSINWSNEEENEFVSATIDSKGFVMNYEKYDMADDHENKLPKISKEEGRNISEKFIKRLNPNVKDNLKYKGNETSFDGNINQYAFEFVRTENNIPYTNNMAYAYFDNLTGEIKSFYISWDRDLNFPDAKEIISKEQAEKTYKENIEFELMYKYKFNGVEENPTLAYSILDKNKSIDAKTGDILDYSNNYFYEEYQSIRENTEIVEVSEKQVDKESIDTIKSTTNIIEDSSAESLARRVTKLDESYELVNVSLMKNNDKYTWYLSFSKDGISEAQVLINANTSEVIHFSKYDIELDELEIKYSKEQAKKIADDYLSKTQSEKFKQVEFVDRGYVESELFAEEMMGQYSFEYIRKANGIKFDGNGFNIIVDARTGDIREYYTSWYDLELPKVESVVSKEEAYKEFSDNINLELQYIRVYDQEENHDTRLSYVPSDIYKTDIDAKTGKVVNLYEPFSDINKPVYKDIEKSFAKDKINQLLDLNIYLPGEKFNPKEEISQKDFLYLLAKCRENYLTYEDTEELYRRLISKKIITKGEKSPDKKISKEEATKYMVKSKGLSKVANIEEIYKLDFKDSDEISKDLRGYVAIAKGLNIVSGNVSGNFNPKQNLTREQAIIMIYNLLNS